MTSSSGKLKTGLIYQSYKNSLSLIFTSVYIQPLNSLWDSSVLLIPASDTSYERLFSTISLDLLSLQRQTTEITVGTGTAFKFRIQNCFQAGEKKNRRENSLPIIYNHANKENSIVCSILYVFIYLASTGTKISQNDFQYAAVQLGQRINLK